MTSKRLDKAWDQLIDDLGEARAALTDPQFYCPPSSDRNDAEGYRYLLGQLHRLIESELQQDADFPYFQVQASPTSKFTIDNADCLYLYAPIKPQAYYRISAKAENFDHWRGARANDTEFYAPNYVIFETHTVGPGDSGGTAELRDGSRVITGSLDSKAIQIESNGVFEILIGPNKPADYRGNFISSIAPKGSQLPRGDTAAAEMQAHKLYVRELFADWECERSLDLSIEQLSISPQQAQLKNNYPQPRQSETTAIQIEQLGLMLKNHMRYWTTMYGELLDPFGTAEQARPSHLAKNQLASPKPASTAGGGGQASNFYAGGLFELDANQYLLIEVNTIIEPEQMGFHLSNYWGESLDYANHVSSLNALQSYCCSDGVYRYVVSKNDPAVQNWLDTTGHKYGYLTMRFTYSTPPALADYPSVAAYCVDQKTLAELLPKDTPEFTRADRGAQIAIRKAHVARRFRQF